MLSIWEQELFQHPKQDICIVGAGLTGLLTALALKEQAPALRISVLESGAFAAGASVKNAGFACFGSLNEFLDDLEHLSFDEAIALVQRRKSGLKKLQQILPAATMGWHPAGGIDLYETTEASRFDAATDLLPRVNQALGETVYEVAENTHFPQAHPQYIFCKTEAALNSGMLVQQLSNAVREKGVDILYNQHITALHNTGKEWEASTSAGRTYRAEKVLLATNGFTKALYSSLNVEPARGQVLLTAPIPGLSLQANVHLERGYYYARPYAGGILLGGGRHLDPLGERSSEDALNTTVTAGLDHILKKHFSYNGTPQVLQRWTGIMGFGAQNEKESILKQVEPGLFCAVRLGGMGIALSSQLGEDAAQLLLEA
jgi:glycine/D-amino acid oxidase-like deaminating enzyme